MKTYRIYVYLLISIYIFIQTSFFPQKLAHPLMGLFEHTPDGRTIISSPQDIVMYYNMVVYGGLAISGSLFLEACRLILRRIAKSNEIVGGAIDLVFRLLVVATVFLCTSAIYHLCRGEKAGLLSLSYEAMVTLLVLILCLIGNYIHRHMCPGKRGNRA